MTLIKSTMQFTASFFLCGCLANAVTINIPQQLTAGLEKGRFIESSSGFDGSKKAALMQTDITFTETCGYSATISDLTRIAKTEAFNMLYGQLKTGHSVGLNQSRRILVDDKKTFCKGRT